MTKYKHILFLSLSVLICIQAFSQNKVLIEWNSQWSYFKGNSEPSTPVTLWRTASFNDVAWPKGNAPFRYGDGTGGTVLSDMQNNYTSFYIRQKFDISNIEEIGNLTLMADYDDGFIVWINGIKVVQKNAPDNPSFDKTSTFGHESGDWESFPIKGEDAGLVNGTNVIAVQGFNTSLTSSDFLINVRLEGKEILPATDATVTINTPSGFFENPTRIKITTSEPGTRVIYTLDGSDPRTSLNTKTEDSPAYVIVDPNSTSLNRGKTGGVIVRASAIADGLSPGEPVSRSYIFLNAVKNVTSHPGGSWPVFNVNGQLIDLLMDTKVTDDPRYKDHMETSLLDIPTITINTDPEHLFDPNSGIYVNAERHGYDWERPANIELINPDGSPGFNVDAGIRIRGGWSRHDGYPKHAFRLFFRKEYGPGQLEFPLFGDEGVDEFQKVDLRCSQNYSWANGGGQSIYNTSNRDVFSRDSQKDMNVPYTRSRYYHLYLNGLYWGLFQTQERGEANFAESYFGGDKDEYDVIKVDVGESFNIYEVEATDGNLDSWYAIWDIVQKGFESNENYFELIGLNSAGEVDTSLIVWIDIDNFIDYMITIFYAGNFDAPVSKFSNNRNPNNFYAIDNRTRKRDGFIFLAHDAEHTLLADPVGPGIGIDENRVKISMNVTRKEKFHPQWLHDKLTKNEEYRIKFADRVYRHFFNNGVFTPDSCIARFKRTSDQLEMAIIAESARWGDSKSGTARTKDDDWKFAIDQITKDYMPYRSDIVYQQLVEENLTITSFMPPVFKDNGTEIIEDKITISGSFDLTMDHINPSGSIIYTTDGTDPRAIGGNSSPSAIDGGKSLTITVTPGTTIKARVRSYDSWSALHDLIFEDSGLFTNLKVTEVHYHPADWDTVGGKQLEFIELKNIGSKTLDLSGLSFVDGITYTFPDGTTLAPNSFVVAASNPYEFERLYGFGTEHGYNGSLSNGGERVILETPTQEAVLDFTYHDTLPWPEEADGLGYSLVSVEDNPTGDPNNHEYWTSSKYLNGSPMADDENSIITDVFVAETREFELDVYPNPASTSVSIDFSIEKNEKVNIGLYDINGRLLHTLVNEPLFEGFHSRHVALNSLDIKPGIYLITYQSESNIITKKLIYNE